MIDLAAVDRGELSRYARRRTPSSEDADDLVQDVLLRALERGEAYFDGENLGGWLMTIAHNEAVNRARRRQRFARALRRLELEAEGQWRGTRPPEPDVAAEASEVKERADQLLGRVTPCFRSALKLFVEGHEYRQIARRLGIPVGTVMSRIHRARRELAAKGSVK